jgi:hypothetical protein
VNRELVLLYWQIGRDIDRQDREGWGAKIIDRLAIDLKRAFPEMKGLSPRNLKYMRRFAEVTNSATSSARIYWENRGASFSAGKVNLPVAASVFPREIFRA